MSETPKDSRSILADNLRLLIAKSGKTRQVVSEEINVAYSTFTDWCNGNKYPRIEKIETLARYFGVSVPALVGNEEANTETDPSDNRAVFAKNLRFYIKKSGRTQKEIADFIGVTPATFSEWSKGKKYPRIEKIELLAQYFGVTKAELIECQCRDEHNKKADSRDAFVNNLRLYMAKADKTRKDVSEAIGVSYFTFSDWCNGKKYPRIEKLEALAQYFGITVAELVGNGGHETEPIKHSLAPSSDNVQLSIGSRIRNRRKQLNMSVDKLAELIGKDRATVYRYENGQIENMPVGLLQPIAQALMVSVEYLMGYENTASQVNRKSSSNADVLDIVVRLHADTEFLKIVEKMSTLDETKLAALQQFLKAFGK